MPDTERLINKAQGDSIISALGTIAANILQVPSEKLIIDWSYTTLPASGDDHTIYAIPTGDADDPWNFYVWNDVDEEWVQFDWTFAVDSALSTTSENPVQNKVITTALGGKVDKVTGKGLSTNDYTNEEKALVAIITDKADADDVEGTKTISGNPLTLTDCAPINAESLVVELEPKQDLHGQSAPYVGGAGDNIFDKDSAVYGFWQSNGTYSSSTDYKTIYCKVTPNTTYAVSGISGWDNWRLCYFNTENPATFTRRNINVSDTFTTDSDTILISFSPDATIYGSGDGVQVEKGNQATPFKPYSNICPITGYTECEVDDVGFNQWDEEWENGDIDANTGAKKTGNYFISKNYIKVSSGNYYIKFGTNGAYGFIYKYNKNGQYLGYINRVANQVFEIPQDTSYILFLVASYGTTYNNDICINISKTEGTPKNGDYVPYHSSNATIQFGQTVYSAIINFLTGECVVDSRKKTISELSFTRETPSGRVRYIASISEMEKKTVRTMANLYSDRYETISDGRSYANCPDYCIFNRPEGGIYINDQRYSSVEDFVTANGDSVIVYPLAEPFTIQLTPEELKLLQDTNNITTNGTTITLGYQPDNVIGDVKGEIEKITEMPYLRILDNDVDTEIKNYRLYYRLISSSYTLVNLAEMLQHRFLFVEVIQNPSGTANHTLLHSALIDPRTIDGFEYQMKAGTGDTVIIKLNIDESKFDLSVRYTGTHTSGDPTDYYVTIRLVD